MSVSAEGDSVWGPWSEYVFVHRYASDANARCNNNDYGYVEGTGAYDWDDTVHMRAVPRSDEYRFVRWIGGGTEDTVSFVMPHHDTTLFAYFEVAPPDTTPDPPDDTVSLHTAADDGVSVFPNPATRSVTIASAKPMAHIAVVNAAGQTVLECDPRGEAATTIDTSRLPSGVYQLRITLSERSASERTVSRRLTIQHR